MNAAFLSLLLAVPTMWGADASALSPGDHYRSFQQEQWRRRYLVHVPARYDGKDPTPVVLVLHGAAMNAARTVEFTGMNEKSDEAGFLAVYPEGTGFNPLLTWNAGGLPAELLKGKPDDVEFIRRLLDDLATVARVDSKRVYATGMSNGGMMCYLLADRLSDRIAAIAPVAGTMTADRAAPARPVPVLHFHGTSDTIVPFRGLQGGAPGGVHFQSVDATVAVWREVNGCPPEPSGERHWPARDPSAPHPAVAREPGDGTPSERAPSEKGPSEKGLTEPVGERDDTRVIQRVFGPGRAGSEVVLVTIEGGGHTWPGREPVVKFLGKSTTHVSANDLLWEFFQRHRLP